MKNKLASPPTRGFWIISALALLWNLLGVMAYIMRVTMTPEALAALPEAERELYTNTPAWVTGVFAIAVFAGTLQVQLHCSMRRTWAIHAFRQLSAVAIACPSHARSVFMSDALAVPGLRRFCFRSCCSALGAYLVFYSRAAARNGVLR
ncbi:MAG: hypothetical protein U5K38_05175 [Woeseiaceae bacterium]|nr:hypothetical protein [Woeseiaceae bacterium]